MDYWQQEWKGEDRWKIATVILPRDDTGLN